MFQRNVILMVGASCTETIDSVDCAMGGMTPSLYQLPRVDKRRSLKRTSLPADITSDLRSIVAAFSTANTETQLYDVPCAITRVRKTLNDELEKN